MGDSSGGINGSSINGDASQMSLLDWINLRGGGNSLEQVRTFEFGAKKHFLVFPEITFYQVPQCRTWSRNYKFPSSSPPTRFRFFIFSRCDKVVPGLGTTTLLLLLLLLLLLPISEF
jgi:hypothetical protein